MATWHDRTTIRAIWSEATRFTDAVVDELLATAKFDLLAIGPELADENAPTQGYREAQLLTVKALVASRNGNAGAQNGEIGIETMQVRRAHYRRSTDIMSLLYPDRDWIA